MASAIGTEFEWDKGATRVIGPVFGLTRQARLDRSGRRRIVPVSLAASDLNRLARFTLTGLNVGPSLPE